MIYTNMYAFGKIYKQTFIQGCYFISAKGSASPPSPPVLTVRPSNDYIGTGQTLTFTCQTSPAPLNPLPDAFFLIRTSRGTLSSMLAPPKLVSRSQKPSFSVKAMGRDDSWEYACLYQLTLPKTGRVNSTTSRPVRITVIGKIRSNLKVLY